METSYIPISILYKYSEFFRIYRLLRDSPFGNGTTLSRRTLRRGHANVLKVRLTENRVDERKAGTNLLRTNALTIEVTMSVISGDRTRSTLPSDVVEPRTHAISGTVELFIGERLNGETASAVLTSHKASKSNIYARTILNVVLMPCSLTHN